MSSGNRLFSNLIIRMSPLVFIASLVMLILPMFAETPPPSDPFHEAYTSIVNPFTTIVIPLFAMAVSGAIWLSFDREDKGQSSNE